ncbi:MAG TPA: hypothetical protein VEU08_22185, partial [Vicinamibacterales bacterium]|nr:hypothetical protein [Vicinamibacterales bacterium]
MTLVVAILMSPLLYCLAGLALDLVNLARPAPDLLGWAVHEVEALSNAKQVTAPMIARTAFV